jgi:hypothetical protein
MANGIAPVCPITRSEAPSGMPGVKMPAFPRANDLQSVINVVNQMSFVLNKMLGPPPVFNNALFLPFPIPRFTESKRVIQPVRIYNPNDKSQWVDIERISSVSFTDNFTNGQLQWNYVNKSIKPTTLP